MKYLQNKKKIINDPIYGFIQIPTEFIYELIQHSYFQRLRRITQLGLTSYVYPGATHSRFQHVIGATYLMEQALQVLISKGQEITAKEYEGALIAILLHDIGHGPFSHTLEYSFIENFSHEKLSLMFMEKLNEQFEGRLSVSIDIFTDKYPKKFLHQLVSSQLDMDRLDYLRRDSFFTGVSEGVVGSDRIIKMLVTRGNNLMIEEKGIYSVEKFLIARRLMYWQVYLHKTVVAAEQMLIKLIKRAKYIFENDKNLFLSPNLKFFFENKIANNSKKSFLDFFSGLDDNDIIISIKEWQNHSDFILSFLSKSIINRDLFKIIIQNSNIKEEEINIIKEKTIKSYPISKKDIDYLVFTDSVKNNAYSDNVKEKINILGKDEKISDIAIASDVSNVAVLSQMVEKFYICFPKFKN
ncbi:MAG: HD domain-containing protein [Bacteroidales bacterium]|nr:HD domain-containing protein [Bacteroidales bacterium]MBN2757757.1 HD domain-containing protein [Bacteroidales bacterium]